MGKRIANVTLKRQNNWFKHHRRTLENDDLIYEPFWRIEDIPSWGVKTKVPHFETRHRIVHLLSQNEFWMYLHLVQNPLVIEIYEQYAVPLDLSLAIAEELDVKHPVYPRTKIPTIQTIDFVADVCNPETGEIVKVAYPVKQTSDALRYRTAEKLALQEAYCAVEDIDYELITSDQLRTTKSINLECLYRHRNPISFFRNLIITLVVQFLWHSI